MDVSHFGARRGAIFASAVAATILLSVAATAWACVPFAALTVTPSTVEPGQVVTVTGAQFNKVMPVVIHLDGLDGRELARAMADSPKGPFFSVTVVIPADVPPGSHVLVATQDQPPWGGLTWGVPARALVTVGHPTSAAASPPAAVGTVRLTREPVGWTGLVLVGLGVSAIALLGFGVVAAVASGRRSGRRTAAVSS
jgi:hypothetical protein